MALKEDEAYQREVARDLCESGADIIIGCIGGGGKGGGYEADWWVDEWRQMGTCNPKAVWLTCTTWGWTTEEHDEAYMLGGGQWHPAMTYSVSARAKRARKRAVGSGAPASERAGGSGRALRRPHVVRRQ